MCHAVVTRDPHNMTMKVVTYKNGLNTMHMGNLLSWSRIFCLHIEGVLEAGIRLRPAFINLFQTLRELHVTFLYLCNSTSLDEHISTKFDTAGWC